MCIKYRFDMILIEFFFYDDYNRIKKIYDKAETEINTYSTSFCTEPFIITLPSQQAHDVIITSPQRRCVASTLRQHYIYVMCPLGLSGYDFDNIERDVKHQLVIITYASHQYPDKAAHVYSLIKAFIIQLQNSI